MIDIEALLRRLEELGSGPQAWGDPMIMIEARNDPKRWMQIVRNCVNAAYPYEDDPAVKMRGFGRLKAPLPVLNWEGKKFATFGREERPHKEIAGFIQAYMGQALGMSLEERDLKIMEEDLGGVTRSPHASIILIG